MDFKILTVILTMLLNVYMYTKIRSVETVEMVHNSFCKNLFSYAPNSEQK